MPAIGLSKTTKRFSETFNMEWMLMHRLVGSVSDMSTPNHHVRAAGQGIYAAEDAIMRLFTAAGRHAITFEDGSTTL
jgi:hypothetical protein